jgi:hypothetical protein
VVQVHLGPPTPPGHSPLVPRPGRRLSNKLSNTTPRRSRPEQPIHDRRPALDDRLELVPVDQFGHRRSTVANHMEHLAAGWPLADFDVEVEKARVAAS